MYSQTTRSIKVTVESIYMEDQSLPEESQYMWAYHVKIINQGNETVQLKKRYWRITDSLGHIHEVRGDGVVGQQPIIKPGQSFEYASGTPLTTPSGIMFGSYQMENEAGESFDITIPAFSLDSPYQPIKLN
ncbi:MAG: Co2+/Mg2+ efflux protein ApaG [Alphaproteobacteria bacterium]|nr:Co2+/Mg2+ efflux protein ApaG [Alphaproteobacteria bacterium]